MADWTPPPPGAWAAPQGGFTPIPGMAPNPKIPLEVQGAGLSNATAAAKLPYVAPQSAADAAKTGAEAQSAAVAARYAAPLAAAKLQDTQSASTDAQAKAQQQADQHALQARAKATLDDATRYAILPTLDRAATDVQRPLATGTMAKLLAPFSAGDYGTNANFVANELQAIKTNTAMQNILSERAMSPTGSNGMRVTQTEFNKFGDAWNSLDQNQPAGVLQNNISTIRTIFRNALLRGHGIDPNRSKLLLPGNAPNPSAAPAAAAAPQSRVIDWHELP